MSRSILHSFYVVGIIMKGLKTFSWREECHNVKHLKNLSLVIKSKFNSQLSNSNWTERSTIQGVIARVISKPDEREAQY